MALINCPECGKEVSDKVKNCIHCGYPLTEEIELPLSQENNITSGEVVKKKLNKKRVKFLAPFVVIVVMAAIVSGVIYNQKVIKPEKTYESAVELLESGKYEEAKKLFEKIPTYKNVKTLKEESKYESMVCQCIISIKKRLKKPDSLLVRGVNFYQGINDNVSDDEKSRLEKLDSITNDKPFCFMMYGAENGYGGNSSSYAIFMYSKENEKYGLVGTCNTLKENEINDEDEKMICKMINIYNDNFKTVGKVDLSRIEKILKTKSYSMIE
jgi:uncharacterized OB-fold protein